jgi:hypothetical protein
MMTASRLVAKISLGLVVSCWATVTVGQVTSPQNQVPNVDPPFKNGGLPTKVSAKMLEFRRILKEANAQEAGGRTSLAISSYLKLESLGLVPGLPDMALARLYARTGNQDAAYGQLHRVLNPPIGAGSSYQHDVALLTYYGDLCLDLRKEDEARQAFLQAGIEAGRISASPFKAMFSNAGAQMPTERLRSIALAAVACSGEFKLRVRDEYASEAVAIDRESPLARLVYAAVSSQGGKQTQAMEQSWEAEQLAESGLASDIKAYRIKEHLFYSGSRAVTDPLTGKTSEKFETFKPVHPVWSGAAPSGFKTRLPEE